MNSITIYEHMEYWGTIFGIGTKEIDRIFEKYNRGGVLTSRQTNLDVLITVCRTDYID